MSTSGTSSSVSRRELLDWNLLYLFSFDIELDVDRQQKLGRFPDGFHLNVFLKRGLSHVYNVGRETTVVGDGRPSVGGDLEWGSDEIILREDDVAGHGVLAEEPQTGVGDQPAAEAVERAGQRRAHRERSSREPCRGEQRGNRGDRRHPKTAKPFLELLARRGTDVEGRRGDREKQKRHRQADGQDRDGGAP